ncbi:MAG: protein-L-isoaspartate(D-aspartate) O-methyltransferase [Syntrophobacterales bacterium]|jgi:protein-L-isoaspartate(D-aspartate) O-methyltransferase
MKLRHFTSISTFIIITVGIFILIGAAQHSALSEQDQKTQLSQPAETSWTPPRFSEYQRERALMVRSQMMHRYPGVRDKPVLEAMRQVPRHLFVPWALKRAAHADRPLPIGHGQTISQPYIVGLMTQALKMKPDGKVLEIGTGSGYQAAVLSELTPRVFTIEIIRALGEEARERLQKLGYQTIQAKIGDGYFGWPEEAPFDGIIVTCAAGHIPPPLIEQLREGGRMVIPVGGTFEVQRLMVVTKDQEGKVQTEELLPVRFVPMTGAIQKAR